MESNKILCNRRLLLKGFLGVYLTLAPGKARAARRTLGPGDLRVLGGRLFEGGAAEAQAVGLRALDQGLGPRCTETLFQRLCPTAEDLGQFGARDSETAREWFRCRVREDYRLGRTGRVDGWLLSEHELTAAMLVAL